MVDQKHSTRLRAVRQRLQLTQEQMAQRLGVSFATVNRWEAGATTPQRKALEALDALERETQSSGDHNNYGAAAGALVRRTRRGHAANDASSTKPMEQMLWDAASSIRGEKDAAKFKD